MSQRPRMVAKIGSQALCDPAGRLEASVLSALAGQIARLRERGWDVLLISSGAVAAGREVAGERASRISNPVTRQQVLAAAGQVSLMASWQAALAEHGLRTAQVLVSKSDFQSRQHYLNMRACLEGVLAAGLVPVVNENDVVSVTELMFTDNDELAGLLAGMVDAELLCLLSTVHGVLGADGETVIARWDDEEHRVDDVLREGASRLGRGGMHSKLSVARKTASLGTDVVIAHGQAPDVLTSIAAGEATGTRFSAQERTTPAKRWLASMDDHALGSVTVNAGAAEALRDPHRLASLLPVGVDEVEGSFQQGDVIQVRDPQGDLLGCGRSGYDAEEARAALGQRDRKPIIHYDYLYLVDGQTHHG